MPGCTLSRFNQRNSNLCKYPATIFKKDKQSFKHIQRARKTVSNWTREKRWANVFFVTVYNLTLWCALSLKYCSKVSGIDIITSLNWDVCQLITYIKMSSSCVENNVNDLPLVSNPTYFAISIMDSSIKPSIDLCIWLNILNCSLT